MKWFVEFSNEWGNVASIIGFAMTLIGFVVVLLGQRKIRALAREAIEKVGLQILAADLEELYRHLTALRQASRSGEWLRGIDRCHDAQTRISRLVGNPSLLQNEKGVLRVGGDDLTLIIRYIERYKIKVPDASRDLPEPKKKVVDALVSAVSEIRARLVNQALEV